MSEQTQYAPGTPSWADIGTDVEAAKAFYAPLFGWTAQDAGPVEETGGYGFFTKDGKNVVGYGPQQSPGPPFWSTYVTVADADESAAKAQGAGGTVVMPPMDVMSAGRMAVIQDPQGAFVSIWQPKDNIGADVVNEAGTMCWNELNARDTEKAKAFYREVFGWDAVTHSDGPMTYTEFALGGRSVAGMLDMPPMVPAEVPSFWLVYFAVDDPDATVEQAKAAGATLLAGPMDIQAGRFAVLSDPQGATFAVIRLNTSLG